MSVNVLKVQSKFSLITMTEDALCLDIRNHSTILALQFVSQYRRNCHQAADSLLHVSICRKSLVSQVILKGSKEMESTRYDSSTVDSMVHNLSAVAL